MFPNTAWGGPGRSSIGRELGDFGLMNFLEPKQVRSAVVLSLRTTTHPLYTRVTKRVGASLSEPTMRGYATEP
jgi:hypothetical protein